MSDYADCGPLGPELKLLGSYLDQLQQHPPGDAGLRRQHWQGILRQPLPVLGSGQTQVLETLGEQVIPNGSPIPLPGFTSFITTGPVNIGVLAATAAMVASPQRIGLSAFHELEELSLNWLAELFSLPSHMKGVYSSGGSSANLLALGAARQAAYEIQGHDCGCHGVPVGGRIFATASSHRTIHRAAAVLGMGRDSVVTVTMDDQCRMNPLDLVEKIKAARAAGHVPIAIVANAGTTGTGSIDPLAEISAIARQNQIWLHVDGAYGLPGILDDRVRPFYDGLADADSVVVDPHKWLGAPVGIGTTFVRDRGLLQRAFTQGPSDYLEGSFATGLTDIETESDTEQQFVPVLDSMGIPYSDFGVELSAPCRGVVVWALIQEIGVTGLKERVCRHNDMTRALAEQVTAHPLLELLQPPTLSICCFRYVPERCSNLNDFTRRLHRELILRGRAIPSTTLVNGQLALRPCFIGARTGWNQVEELLQEVLLVGDQLAAQHDDY